MKWGAVVSTNILLRSMSDSVSDLVRKRRSARMLQGGVIKYIAYSRIIPSHICRTREQKSVSNEP